MDRATLTFLQSFPERIRKEGEALQKDGCVKQIFGNHLFVQGRVEDGDVVYRTTLRLQGDEWVGGCSSDPSGRSSAVYATMLERVDRGTELPEAPNEIGEQTLADLLEEKLGRRLEPREEEFVTKLEKRYRRFEMEQEVYDHDLVRLNRKWPTDTYDPLELWNQPPRDILEFWNYIAYAFDKRNLGFPPFMKVVTDLEATRSRIEGWERDRERQAWVERLRVASGPVEAPEPLGVAFRLVVLPGDARLQVRRGDEGFETVATSAELAQWSERADAGLLEMDGASDLLWSRVREACRQADGGILRLENPEHTRLVGMLLDQEALADRLVTLDEEPLNRPTAPLRWECREPAGDGDGFEGDGEPCYVLQLCTGDGEEVAHSVRVLSGRRDWYLSDDSVFLGPPHWGEGTEMDPRFEVPVSVMATEDGLRFLDAVGAALPASLRERTIDVDLRVSLEMRLSRHLTGAESEHLLVTARAVDPEGRRTESLTRDGWRVSESAPAPEGRLYRFDRHRLSRVPEVLEAIGLIYDPGIEAFKVRATKAFPERFVAWLEEVPDDWDLEFDPMLESLRQDPVQAKVRFELTGGEIDWFDLKIVLDVEGLDLSQEELRALVAARGGFVRVNDGGWLRLEFDLDERQRSAVDKLGLDVYDLSGDTHRMHVLQLADPAAKEVFDEKAWDRICSRSASLKLQVQPEVPSDLDATLRNYQVEGFHFLSYLATNRFGGILADDMGLGKTVQSLAWLLWLRDRRREQLGEAGGDEAIPPVLVVCPKSVLDVWAGECAKFAHDLQVQVLRSKEELDLDRVREGTIDLLVLNYSQLRVNAERLDEIAWLAVILDEAQQIKNPDSKAAKAARSLKAENRLVLTGTPIENRLLDVWSLMAFAMPGVLGDRAYFRKRFDRRKDPEAQVRLSARLRPFLLRRTKNQVAVDLPPKIEEDIFCKMEGRQEELYQAELKRIQDILLGLETDEALRKNSFVVLQGLMRLRQICCHPALVEPSADDEESAKMGALFYLIDQLQGEGHKVLVFSQFVTMLDLIRERLEEENRPFEYLTGQTQNRHEVIERFHTSKDPSVFLLSLKAGGSGLNLTAASYVVLYDPWWNPAVENQAIDRTHRIGQKSRVIAYRLLMRDSVEEKIRVLQNQKRSLVTGILGQESFTKNLTRDDLAFLLKGAD